MKTTLKLEEAAMLLLSFLMFAQQTSYPWWMIPACILLPDLSMLGYVVNNKVGAYLYNFFHHKGVALFIYFIGLYMDIEPVIFIGILLFAHSCLDRIFGFGLKYTDDFKHTHLD
ncbi:uncharacterized protein DUF4260 [Chitinophaga skermanii]|uniref:Uncharacterized protein DUF4260 n=1 Tax=Chitinophaga skermanii TaxID=331697 RepID=A0A327QQZ9_9BACT|nr:DUF4260 domain-containing protein [Chitinophaga skermanii]RAJ06989.1 uncharacterized protein DUF4260 [Chitinophaga skermanii]